MAISNTFSSLLPDFKEKYSMHKPKLGSGERFKHLSGMIQKKEGYSKERANAIAAAAGRKKYGNAKMNKMAQAGKHHHSK